MNSIYLLKYPLIFGVLGAIIGLILRVSYVEPLPAINFKYVLHAHSHVMLLGFVFNALILLVWKHYTNGIDKNSYRYFIGLQVWHVPYDDCFYPSRLCILFHFVFNPAFVDQLYFIDKTVATIGFKECLGRFGKGGYYFSFYIFNWPLCPWSLNGF